VTAFQFARRLAPGAIVDAPPGHPQTSADALAGPEAAELMTCHPTCPDDSTLDS
jgi:hypothetical protein